MRTKVRSVNLKSHSVHTDRQTVVLIPYTYEHFSPNTIYPFTLQVTGIKIFKTVGMRNFF